MPRVFGHDCNFPDYLYEFAANNRDAVGMLLQAVAEYDVYRPGFHYVEASERPEWQKRKRYSLNIYPIGSGNQYFGFNYRDEPSTREAVNEIEWQGHALAAQHILYLVGADSRRDVDLVLFMLAPHSKYGFDLLVGMHLAQIDDDDVLHRDTHDRRRLAVSRRVAAVRKGAGPEAHALRGAACNWIDNDLNSMGAVATLIEPSLRHLRGEE